MRAPIAYFAYNRSDHAVQSLEALSRNIGADESELFIFCDGAKGTDDEDAVNDLRRVVKSKQWCGKTKVTERERNYGCAKSIITGITEICERYGRIIVVEDDIVVAPYFLDYMNRALDRYENESKVMQISAHMFPLKIRSKVDTFFLPFTTSWGWATWQRAWVKYDSQMHGYKILKNDMQLQKKFDLNGSYPFFSMLNSQVHGGIDTWDIQWYLSVFISNGLTLFPANSLVRNVGFDGSGVHYKNDLRISASPVFNQMISSFPKTIAVNNKIYKQVRHHLKNEPSKIQCLLNSPIIFIKQLFKK